MKYKNKQWGRNSPIIARRNSLVKAALERKPQDAA